MKRSSIFIVCIWIGIVCGMMALVTNCQKLGDSVELPSVTVEPEEPVSLYPTEGTSSSGIGLNSGGVYIADALTNGQSVGIVNGGFFSQKGYTVTASHGGYVMYVTDIVGDIKIEFYAQGYVSNDTVADNKAVLLELYDGDPWANWMDPDYWQTTSHFRYELRKRGYDSTGVVTDALDLKFGCEARGVGKELKSWRGHCLAGHPISWNPSVVYHWVVTVVNGRTQVIRDGQLMYDEDCSVDFAPEGTLTVRIGGTSHGRGGPTNVTYWGVNISQM